MAYHIDYSDRAVGNLRSLTAAQRTLVQDEVDIQLTHQPTLPTRNRKLMCANRLATWELRVRDLRVYYEVVEAEQVVVIVAVGLKVRDRVFVGGQEVNL